MKAIKSLKNNKATGEDMICNEMLKQSAPKLLSLWTKLFNFIFDTGALPDAWLNGMNIPLYKNKGDPNDLSSCRGITLLSCVGKLFTTTYTYTVY